MPHFSIRFLTSIELIGFILLHENGKIWAESDGEGKGCTFFVCVPVYSHQTLVPTSTQSCSSPRGLTLSSLAHPVHHYAQIDIDPESSRIALNAVSLMQSLSITSMHESTRLLPILIPVITAWKPTILVVDDSPMNRKVIISLPYPIRSYPITLTDIHNICYSIDVGT